MPESFTTLKYHNSNRFSYEENDVPGSYRKLAGFLGLEGADWHILTSSGSLGHGTLMSILALRDMSLALSWN